MKTLDWNTLRIHSTLYHTYQLLYCKGRIQITSSHSIMNMKRNIWLIKMKILDWNTFKIYISLYHTYQLLYCKGHIQIIRSHSSRNIDRKIVDLLKWKHWLEIHLKLILCYIILTNYYIVKETFRSQVVTVP